MRVRLQETNNYLRPSTRLGKKGMNYEGTDLEHTFQILLKDSDLLPLPHTAILFWNPCVPIPGGH